MSSNINKKLNTLDEKGKEIENKLLYSSSMQIDDEAKESIKNKLEIERTEIDKQIAAIRYEKIMKFNYDKNLAIIEKRLKQINLIKENLHGYKSIINNVIALDRENLLFCIHLTNRNFTEIVLENEVFNEPIMSGITPYIQTRLSLKINWKVIII